MDTNSRDFTHSFGGAFGPARGNPSPLRFPSAAALLRLLLP